MAALIDLTGMTFGEWTVLGRSELASPKPLWRCRCKCGITSDVSGSNLRGGQSRSCGCCRMFGGSSEGTIAIAPGQRIRDMPVRQFGSLKVVAPVDVRNGQARWRCKCVCGKEVIARADGLLSGHTTSCGCLKVVGRGHVGPLLYTDSGIAIENLSGQRFGKLNVLSYSHTDARGSHWQVRCDCGTTKVMPAGVFRTGKQYSCGCAKMLQSARKETYRKYTWFVTVNGERIALRSGYEVVVARYFLRHRIPFQYEPKVFRLEGRKRYIPDFYLPNDAVYIEVKGFMRPGDEEQAEQFRTITGNRLVFITKSSIREYLPAGMSYEVFLRRWRKTHHQ